MNKSKTNKTLITIDTIRLSSTFNKMIKDNLIKFYSNNSLTEDYVVKRYDIDNEQFAVGIKKKGFDSNFLFIKLKDNPYKLDDTEIVNSSFTIHLNHFYDQVFEGTYIEPSDVIEILEDIIRKVLHFQSFNLNRLKVSSVDLALDMVLKEDANQYLDFLKFKSYPRYILHPNRGNGTLSIHSFKSVGEINNPNWKTENKGTFYNKLKKMGLGDKILRLELKLSGNKKNDIPLTEYNSYGVFDLERTGITSFSDLFKADLPVVVMKQLGENFILKNKKELLSTLNSKNYQTKSDRWRLRFDSVDEYYELLSPLIDERNIINDFIKSEREIWVNNKLLEDHPTDLLNSIWDQVNHNLANKFRREIKLSSDHEGIKVDDFLADLKQAFFTKSFKDFIDYISIQIHKKENYRVDNPSESTIKVIKKFFEKKFNADKQEYKEKLLKDVRYKIASLNRDFKRYQKYNFLHELIELQPSGSKGIDLYNELCEVLQGISHEEHQKVFNLYKYYREKFGLTEHMLDSNPV